MSGAAFKGKASLELGDYPSAIKFLSEALKTSEAPNWLLQRSTAYHRIGQHENAIRDANKALLIAIKRGKRELIAESHHRRGIVFHGLKQYGNARMCFYWARKYNEKLPGLTMWISKVTTDYDASGSEEAESNAITVKEVPDVVEEVEQKVEPAQSSSSGNDNEKSKNGVPTECTNSTQPNSKIRHEWYQSKNTVTVEILAKSVPKDAVKVDIQERSLDVSFTTTSVHNTCNFSFEPLFSKIEISKSSYRVTPHKIEITLHKCNSGLKWPNLQLSEPIPVNETIDSAQGDDSKDIKIQSQAPVYPTSSKNGPKNWDTVVNKEAEDDEADADGPDAFFKMLYKNADPDTKRAMIKSYQESNGTSLSTQWSDVGSRKFEVIPPEGVEVKKWDT